MSQQDAAAKGEESIAHECSHCVNSTEDDTSIMDNIVTNTTELYESTKVQNPRRILHIYANARESCMCAWGSVRNYTHVHYL